MFSRPRRPDSCRRKLDGYPRYEDLSEGLCAPKPDAPRERPLDDITVDDLLALIGDLRESGYSAWSIRSILTPLSRLVSHAVRREVIAVQPDLEA